MRFLSGMLAGAVLVSGAIVAAGGRLALLFAAGIAVGLFLSTALTATFARKTAARPAAGPGVLCTGAPVESPAALAGSSEGGSTRRKRRGCSRPAVQSRRSMLTSLQQETVSALMNLGASFRDAEAAVLAATPGNEGKGFDELFRLAVALLNGRGPARKAAV